MTAKFNSYYLNDTAYLEYLYSRSIRQGNCLVWNGATNWKGYGRVNRKGKNRSVHVVVWELVNKRSIPPGLQIRHRCDNPSCIAPEHLIEGTQSDNVTDALDRDRYKRGPEHYRSKLSTSDIEEIRSLRSSGYTLAAIACKFNVSLSHVHRIVRLKARKKS